ncbi:MAG: dihydrolipoamide acetyltransferase family protein [Tuberibacillus sp.]
MFELRLPKISEDGSESVIVFWHKSEGDVIKKGDILVEVQTEKAVSDIEADHDGVLTKVLKKRGEVVMTGEVLAVITPQAESQIDSPEAPSEFGKTSGKRTESPAFVRVPPRVRKRAAELCVALQQIKRTGPRGMATMEDVEKAAQLKQGTPLSPSRKVIAERMMHSLQSTAQLTITTWADVTDLKEWRDNQTEKYSWNTLCLYAAAQALRSHPELNARVQEDRFQQSTDVNLGLAVDSGEALVVPVIKRAEHLDLNELEETAKRLIEKAQNGKLTVEESQDGTFTVTNLGRYNIEFFTPIINPPQVAILGIGAIDTQLAIEYGDIIEKYRLPLSLTFDHRVIDGAPCARYLQSFMKHLNQISQAVYQE